MSTVAYVEKKEAGQEAFLGFFGLREQPFGVTPDPRLLYLTHSHREALASLIYAIETKRGFSALVAEPGMGKTTLLFYLLDRLKSTARTAFLFRPDANAKDLLQSLLLDLGLMVNSHDVPQMHEVLNTVLLDDLRAGKHFVWVIDEAQDLDNEVLESVRLLSNFETPVSKLMHIILAGQPGLADKLAQPELLQLRQRISTLARLNPLSEREVSAYIQYRGKRAGCINDSLFSAEARRLIAQESLGIPRNINGLCFSCLSLAFVEKQKQIDPGIVRKVLRDPAFEMFSSQPVPSKATSSKTSPEVHARAQEPPPAAAPTWPTDFLNERIPPSFVTEGAPRSGLWLAIAALGFVILPVFLVLLSSSSRIRSLEAINSPAAENIVSRVTGLDVHLPDPPATPASTVQPPVELKPVSDATKSPVAEAPAPAPATKPSTRPKFPVPEPRHSKSAVQGIGNSSDAGPRSIYTRGGENLFQLAMEYYGKANWTIVSRIRAQNPEIGDPYTVFKERQHLILPDLAPQFPWKDNSLNGR
jgi:type II secretory pathway predicted ATPase ExeA/phage tail protein X